MKKYIIILFIFIFAFSSMPQLAIAKYNYTENKIASTTVHPIPRVLLTSFEKDTLSSCLQQEYLMRDFYRLLFSKYPSITTFSVISLDEDYRISELKLIYNKYRVSIPEDEKVLEAKKMFSFSKNLLDALNISLNLEKASSEIMNIFIKNKLTGRILEETTTIRNISMGMHTAAFNIEIDKIPENMFSPFTLPDVKNRIDIPTTIDATGKNDVSTALNYFISNVPDNTLINFPASAIYRIDSALKLYKKQNIIINGNGCTIKYVKVDGTSEEYSLWRDMGEGSNISIKNFNLIGSSPFSGVFTPGNAPNGGEYQHGFVVRSSFFEISNCSISNTWGDGFLIDSGSNNVWIHNNNIASAGRNGIAICSGTNILVENNIFNKVGYHVFDTEPYLPNQYCEDIIFRLNFAGAYCADKYFFNIDGNNGAIVKNISVDSNIVFNDSLSANASFDNGIYSQNISFTNNIGDIITNKRYLSFFHVNYLIISDNLQDKGFENLIKTNDCYCQNSNLSSRPFPAPNIEHSYIIPSNIDSTGKTDVFSVLVDFIGSIPDGSIINFPASATYRIDKAIEFSSRHNLIFNGNGCVIKYTRITGTDEPFSIFLDSKKGSNILVKNFVLVGSSPFSGIFTPGDAPNGGQNQCGVIIRSDYTEISNCIVSNVWGDGFYVVDNPSNIWIHDNHVISAGRNGTSIISGKNIIIENNIYDKVGFMAFDVEPNWPGEESDNVVFRNNTIGAWGHYFSGIVGNSVSASINNIKIENNVITNKYLSAYINSRNGTRITNIVFSNNKGAGAAKGPLVFLEQVDGYSIENNIQALSSGNLISIKDSKKGCTSSNRPFSYITSYNLVPVPSSIDSTGKTDTSVLLNNFIKNVPDGSTINFPSNGIYRIDKALFFKARHNLIIDGNNCTLKYTSITGTKQSYSFFYDEGEGSDIWIKNFNFIGSSPYPGVYTPGEAPYGGEYQHGVVIASERFEVSSCHVSDVWGDGFIVFGGSAYIHDNHVISAGRQGISVISCSSALVENNIFDKVGGSALDIEPIGASDSCTNISFKNNIIGNFGTPKLFTPYVFNVVNNASSNIDNIIIDSNTVLNGSISTYIDSCKESRIKNITFTNNTGTIPQIGPVIYIKHVDGVNIWKNVQPLISGNLTWVPDCTKVVTSFSK